MAATVSGQITAIYLFDVAEEIDLAAVPGLLAAQPAPARLSPKPATPAYVQYQSPPLVIDGEILQRPEIDGFRARFKVYPYGVVSVALTRPFSGGWGELIEAGQRLIDGEGRRTRRRRLPRPRQRLRPALELPRASLALSEDYVVFAFTSIDPP